MPRVHLVASLLKQWLIGTHRGRIQRHHLDYYLDEFTFLFNHRGYRPGCNNKDGQPDSSGSRPG